MDIEVSMPGICNLLDVIERKNLSISQAIKIISEHAEEYGKIEKELSTIQSDDLVLSVDYGKTLEQMIVNGRYDGKNDDINSKNFPFNPKLIGLNSEISVKLFHFDFNIYSVNVITEMSKVAYRPATLAELLSLGEAYPGLQRQFPIVGLGSVWDYAVVGSSAPVLSSDNFGRILCLPWFGIHWDNSYRFLGVCKKTGKPPGF